MFYVTTLVNALTFKTLTFTEEREARIFAGNLAEMFQVETWREGSRFYVNMDPFVGS